MFQELMPLLAQRMLLVTLSRVSDEQISVNVIPKPLKSDHVMITARLLRR
jgi:hypothetical protein